jgi:CrcB protein
MLKSLILVGSGGALGSVSRFLATRWVQNYFLSSFPFGTFAVNIIGSLLIGIFFGLSEKYSFFNSDYKLFLTTGFCGGFTTFSTFANENIMLLKDTEIFYAFLYTALSIIIGFSAAYLGAIFIKIL